MHTQRDEILSELNRRGWRATLLENRAPDWWADEVWLLESEWSPRSSQAYLTFLVDPMAEPHARRPGEHVWAAAVTARKPLGRQEAEVGCLISLGKNWKARLPELCARLDAWRGAPPATEDERDGR